MIDFVTNGGEGLDVSGKDLEGFSSKFTFVKDLPCGIFDAVDIDFKLSLQIVSKDLSDPVRSHKDLDKDAAPYFKKAVKFYEGLAKQLVSQGHVLDLFASALDQVCASLQIFWYISLPIFLVDMLLVMSC